MQPAPNQAYIDRMLDWTPLGESKATDSAVVREAREEIRRRAQQFHRMGLSVGVPLFEAVVDNIDIPKLARQIAATDGVTYDIVTDILARVRAAPGIGEQGSQQQSQLGPESSIDRDSNGLQQQGSNSLDSSEQSQPGSTSSEPSPATTIQWPGPAPAHAFVLKHWFDIAVAKCKNEGRDAVIISLDDLEGLSDGASNLYAKIFIAYQRLIEHLPEDERGDFENEGWYRNAVAMGQIHIAGRLSAAEESTRKEDNMFRHEQGASSVYQAPPPKPIASTARAVLPSSSSHPDFKEDDPEVGFSSKSRSPPAHISSLKHSLPTSPGQSPPAKKHKPAQAHAQLQKGSGKKNHQFKGARSAHGFWQMGQYALLSEKEEVFFEGTRMAISKKWIGLSTADRGRFEDLFLRDRERVKEQVAADEKGDLEGVKRGNAMLLELEAEAGDIVREIEGRVDKEVVGGEGFVSAADDGGDA